MALHPSPRRNAPTIRGALNHRPRRQSLFTLGRTPPRAPARPVELTPEIHQMHNCTITFLRDHQGRVRSVIVDIPRRRPVRVTPQEYEKWSEIAREARKRGRGRRLNIANMAAGIVAANPGVFSKLVGHGKTIGGDALQALIDITMNA
ncbi:MAG: hypothetical protein AABW68_01225 [archaeon]